MVVEMLVRGLIGLAVFAVLYAVGNVLTRKEGAVDDAHDIGLD